MSLAPIIVFCFNRPEHLRKTLEALSNNDLANDSNLFIFCDGPKKTSNGEDIERIKRVREIAKMKQWCGTNNVIEHPNNKGLKNNIIEAVTDIISQYGKVITLEDDVITSKGFLKYMNDALNVYEHEKSVMHISAYMWPHRWPLRETFFFEVPYPGGGWATWERAWKYYSDNTDYLYNYWKKDWGKFNKLGGDYLQKQLEANLSGDLNTWFIKWHAVILKMNGQTLYPHHSLTNNIGFNESATNCHTTSKFDVVRLCSYVNVRKKKVHESIIGRQEILAFYQGRWYNKRRRTKLLNLLNPHNWLLKLFII